MYSRTRASFLRYRGYWCSWATKSRTLCSHYNGHATGKLEAAVLEYLSQFSDPEVVKAHIVGTNQKEILEKESELHDTESAINELDDQFTQNLET